jgi:hypothetical protein
MATSVAAAPGLTITANDASGVDDGARTANIAVVMRELGARLASTSCDACHVDASVTKMTIDTTDVDTTVAAEIRIAISDDRGVLLAVVSGAARATGSKSPLRLAALRAEAVSAAIGGVSSKITASLQTRPRAERWHLVTLIGSWLGWTRELATS